MAKRRVIKKIKPVPKNCFFCKQKKEPTLSEIDIVKRFLTERGKIVPRSRNGLCVKHQKSVTKTIKRGRFLALLPFITR